MTIFYTQGEKVMKILLFIYCITLTLIAQDKIVLNYWTPFSGGDARPMQFIVDKFNKSQNKIVVNMKVIKWADYYSGFDKYINTPNSPNIAIAHASKLSELISKKQILNLSSFSNSLPINWDRLHPLALENVKFGNDYFAVPIDIHLLLTYYNKKYVQNFNQIKNEKNFIEYFRQLKNTLPKEITPLGQPIDNVFPFWLWLTFYNQQNGGGEYIKNNKAGFNNEAGLKALEFLTTLRDNGIYSKPINDEQGYNMFKYNKSALMFTGVWATWNFEQNKDLDFGVAPFIKIYDKQATWSDSHTLVIPNGQSPKIQLAGLQFANFVVNEGLEWSLAGHIPAKKTIIDSKSYLKQPTRASYSQYLKFAYSMPKHPKLWECNDKMIELFVDMMQTKKSAKETLKNAEEEINKILRH